MILEKNQTEQGDLVYQIAHIEIGFHELKHRKMKEEKKTHVIHSSYGIKKQTHHDLMRNTPNRKYSGHKIVGLFKYHVCDAMLLK